MTGVASRVRSVARAALLARALDVTQTAGSRSALVVAPHPDDETLGCGARIALSRSQGTQVTVVVLTGGQRAQREAAPDLEQVRSSELAQAMAVLGVPATDVIELGHLDGALVDDLATVTARLTDLIHERRPDDLYVTCHQEAHPDHAAAALALSRAARASGTGARLWEYPIWLWSDWPVSRRHGVFRGPAQCLTWLLSGSVRKVSVEPVLALKAQALACFSSQLGHTAGETTTGGLPEDVVRRATDGPELYFPVRRRPWLRLVAVSAIAAVAVGIPLAANRLSTHPSPTSAETSRAPGFPSKQSTGVPAGTALVRVPEDARSGVGWHVGTNGNVIVDRPNTILSGLDIHTAVQNEASGLVVRDSRIRCVGENDWCLTLGPGSLVEDTEVGGLENGHTFSTAVGIWSGSSGPTSTIRRVDVHHLQSGLRLDGNVVVEDSFLHDFPMGDPVFDARQGAYRTDMHTDAILTTRGGGVVVRHNRFESGNTANLFVQWDVTDSQAPHIGNYLIEGNLFATVERNGQNSSWGVAVEAPGVDGPITVRDNTFERGWGVGPLSVPDSAEVSNNRYVDGAPVP